MKISVKVKPGARIEKIKKTSEARFEIWVREKAVEGKANQAAIAALSRHLKVPQSRIKLFGGHTSRNKVFQII